MALYTFYPSTKRGLSLTFVCRDLRGDVQAYVYALEVLEQHCGASHVAIWCGDREVAVRGHPVDSGDQRAQTVLSPDLRKSDTRSRPSGEPERQGEMGGVCERNLS